MKLKASERNASEESAPEDTSSEAKSSEARSSEARLSEAPHQKPLHRVDKIQCTKCTTTNSAHASATNISATCLNIKTRITVILLQTMFRFKWNRFEISSSYDKYQIRQKINGEESELQARQVDVTANSQRLSNPLYIGIKTWRKQQLNTPSKRQILCAKRRKQNINNLENSFNSSYLRILKCLRKTESVLFVLYCEYL